MLKKNMQKLLNLAPLFGLLIIILFFAVVTDGASIGSANIKILSSQIIVTALVSIGAVYAFSCGALDMSMGGSVCVTAIIAALVAKSTGSIPFMIATCFGVALLLGLVKGVMAAYMQVPIFIVTIVAGTLFTSFGLLLLGDETTISLSKEINFITDNSVFIGILVVFYLIALVIFNYTEIGKGCKLQGGNIFASRQSGIRIDKNIIYAFLIGGVGVALAAIVIILKSKTVNASTGGTLGTDMMVAIVLGGMPLSGGSKSKISAGIVGAVTITILNNGLTIMGLTTGSIQIVRGLTFLAVVFITSMAYRTKLLPR